MLSVLNELKSKKMKGRKYFLFIFTVLKKLKRSTNNEKIVK